MALVALSLNELIENSESMEEVNTILHTFLCKKHNETCSGKDVETFLYKKSVEFEKQGMARTFLVLYSDDEITYLAGYFSLSNKPLSMTARNFNKLSKSKRKTLLGSGYKTDKNNYACPSVLLGQLGKNINCPKNIQQHQEVRGKDILKVAYEKIKEAYKLLGGKILYLECEDHPNLRAIYEENGFSLLEGYNSDANMIVFVKKLSQI